MSMSQRAAEISRAKENQQSEKILRLPFRQSCLLSCGQWQRKQDQHEVRAMLYDIEVSLDGQAGINAWLFWLDVFYDGRRYSHGVIMRVDNFALRWEYAADNWEQAGREVPKPECCYCDDFNARVTDSLKTSMRQLVTNG